MTVKERVRLTGLKAFIELSLGIMADERAQVASAPGYPSLVARLGDAVPRCALCENVYVAAAAQVLGDHARTLIPATASVAQSRETLFFLGRALDLPISVPIGQLKPFALEQACLALHDCDIVLAVDNALALASIRQKAPSAYSPVETRFLTQMMTFIALFENDLERRTRRIFRAARSALC